jgi:hypothetical protein
MNLMIYNRNWQHKGGTEGAEKYTFFYGKRNDYHPLARRFLYARESHH